MSELKGNALHLCQRHALRPWCTRISRRTEGLYDFLFANISFPDADLTRLYTFPDTEPHELIPLRY